MRFKTEIRNVRTFSSQFFLLCQIRILPLLSLPRADRRAQLPREDRLGAPRR